jgi:hypothetical protein
MRINARLVPPLRSTGRVRAHLVLRDVALVPALDDLLPCLRAIGRQTADWEDQLAAGDDFLQPDPALVQVAPAGPLCGTVWNTQICWPVKGRELEVRLRILAENPAVKGQVASAPMTTRIV